MGQIGANGEMYRQVLRQMMIGVVLLNGGLVAGGEEVVTEYIEVREGSLPLIFTVPHGGSLKPGGLMDRRYGVMTADAMTRELAVEVDRAVKERLGGAAHLVISHLHRSKLDPNRDLTEAAGSDVAAMAAWRRFHAACAVAGQRVERQHGAGLLLDLHGHRHEEPNVELGYLLSGADLGLTDAELSGERLLAKSSIQALVRQTGKPLAELVRGPSSLGALLEARGVRALPSPLRVRPGVGQAYFSGAYIVATHSSKETGGLSAIQVECPWSGVRDTETNRKVFAERLADAVAVFLAEHCGWKKGG
jgi:N-formylglutamate amidohydrolase